MPSSHSLQRNSPCMKYPNTNDGQTCCWLLEIQLLIISWGRTAHPFSADNLLLLLWQCQRVNNISSNTKIFLPRLSYFLTPRQIKHQRKREPVTKPTDNSQFLLYFLYTCHLPAHHRGSSSHKIATLPNPARRIDFILFVTCQLHGSSIRLPNAVSQGYLIPSVPPSNELRKAKQNSWSYDCNWVENDFCWKMGFFPLKNLPFNTGKTDNAFLFSLNEQLWPLFLYV